MTRGAIGTLALLTLACGARTGLAHGEERDAQVEPREDAGPRDAGPPDAGAPDAGRPEPPDCGEAVPVGAVRGSVEDVDARVAVGPDRNLYSVRQVDGGWLAISLDPCLRERWSAPIEGLRRLPRVMIDARGDLWILGQGEPGFWRFSPEGAPLEAPLPIERLLFTWIGVPGDAGPVYATSVEVEEKYLHRIDAAGGDRRVRLETPSSFVYDDECGLFGELAACWNVAYDRRSLEQRWFVSSARIVDGTFRHVLAPAFDGARMWSVEYGISTYRLVGVDLATGARAVETTIMRTSSGQTELLLGPPVLTASGDVAVYVHGTREGPRGALELYAPDGARRWAFVAPRARRSTPAGGAVFSGEATHLAGHAGLLYLAMGHAVYAVEADGTERWRVEGLGDLNEPGVNLSDNGDLYVRDAGGVLTAIATESFGLAASPWPIPGGSARLSNAR